MKLITSKISLKIAFFTTIVTFLSLMAISWVNYQKDIKEIQERHFDIIEAMGKNIAPYINRGAHKYISDKYTGKDALTQTGQDSRYDSLRQVLIEAHGHNNLKTPMYTLVLTDSLKEKIRAAPDTDHKNGTEFIMFSKGIYFRHVYNYKYEMKYAFFNNKISRANPYHDKHGEWISMYFPLTDSLGETVAILEIDDEMTELYAANTQAFRQGMIILSILCLVSSIIMLLVSRYIILPIKKLTKSARKFGDGDLKSVIEVSSSDEINVLAQVMDQARMDISSFIGRILDVIPSILLTFDKEGKILPHTSRRSQILLNDGHDLTGKNIKDVLFRESEELQNLISMAFDPRNKMPFDTLMDLAPDVLELFDKKFKISFRPIYNHEKLEGIFLFGLDITSEIALKDKLEDDNRNNSMYMEIIRNKNLFEGFMHETKLELKRAEEILAQEHKRPEDISELFRIFHTLKGSSASLKILPVSESAHNLESILRDLDSHGSDNQYKKVLAKMETLKQILADIFEQFKKLSGKKPAGLMIENWEIEKLKKSLKSGDQKSAMEVVNSLHLPSLNEYVTAKVNLIFNQTLDSLGKDADLKLKVENSRVPDKVIRVLEPVLIHIIRNAVDHGLENPEIRLEAGKSEKGQLKINVSVSGENLVIDLSDDGGGIDTKKILAKAMQNKIIREEQAPHLDKKEILNLIFESGLSTNDDITRISGRGVGMDAVKNIITDSGGSLEIDSEAGRGTHFQISVPVVS